MSTRPTTLSASLRRAADLLDALAPRSDQLVVFTGYDRITVMPSWSVKDPEERKDLAAFVLRAMRDVLGVTVEKTFDAGAIELSAPFENLEVVYVGGSVCTARVVGTKTVTKKVMVSDPVYEEEEVEVDDVEWDCPGALLADA